jgi:hypothetical protein
MLFVNYNEPQNYPLCWCILVKYCGLDSEMARCFRQNNALKVASGLEIHRKDVLWNNNLCARKEAW